MRKIRIEYPRLFFFWKQKDIDVPEKWEELSEKQFSVCTKLFIQHVPDNQFISEFYSITKRLVNKFSKFEQYKLIECAEFISNPKAKVNYFYLKSIPGTYLHSPEPRLKNILFEQFILFDTFFFDYINDPKEINLQKFIACLYTKENENISDFHFENRLKYIAKNIDNTTMYAIFLNYTFIRKWLSGSFSSLFEYKESDFIDKKAGYVKNKKHNRPDWNAILDGFMGDDVLHEEQYKKIKCIRAFKTINTRIKRFKNGK